MAAGGQRDDANTKARGRGPGRPPAIDRQTLLDKAVDLLRQDGPSGLTVRRLTEELGVSRQVVYTHFGSIGGLVDELYRQGFAQLLDEELAAIEAAPGVDRVVAGCLAYRASARARPELYEVMFERPFKDWEPDPESRRLARHAFRPLIRAIEETGRDRESARSLALSVWSVLHGFVHLELQGWFPRGDRVDLRIDQAVRALLATAA